MNSQLAAVSDMLQGNLHPYFSGTSAAMAANWTMNEYHDKIGGNPVSSGHTGVISEVGWPTAPASAVYGASSVPGLDSLQTLVDSFVCQANTAGIPYYWFEFKDEPWKQDPAVPVEPYWGIFDKDGKLKIKIPDCIAP
ncbi:MAG: glycoside hydrolase superfamily [Podila humilis]|nr:MAG: glycoside hydrolase superfamily [Podila humilis]